MAIKRADVRAIFGETEITNEQMGKLMNLIHTEVDGIKEETDDLRRQLDEERKNSKASDWESKYNKEHDDFEAYKKDQESKELLSKKTKAVEALLKDSDLSDEGKAKALKYTNFDEIELDKDGNVKDGKKHIDYYHKEWSSLVTKEHKGGHDTDPGNPGGGNGGNAFEKMTLTEKMAFANENPTAPEVTAWLGK